MSIDRDIFLPEQPDAPRGADFATVAAVSGDGVCLRLDGEGTAGQKYYKRLASYAAAVGDRVYIVRVSGTILVIGKVV